MRFADRTALVTGASRGIGAAIARSLAAEGALVAVHYGTHEDAAGSVVNDIRSAGGRAFAIGCDLRDVQAIPRMFEVLDERLRAATGTTTLDFLVNNAGSPGGSSFEATTEAEWDQAFDLNAKGLFFVCQHALPRLRDGGRVVNIASMTARGAQPMMAPYAAAKLAVVSLTRSLAQALGPRGITVNAIAPGATSTELTAWLRADPERLRQVEAQTALGRIGEPADIADAVLLLLSHRARWITGQAIEVSGGLRL